ncbi:MAG: PhoH family protein [Clostridia bacterium]
MALGNIIEKTLEVDRMEQIINVFGSFDENVKIIEDKFDVKILNRGNELKIIGEEDKAGNAIKVLGGLLNLSARGEAIKEQNVRYIISLVDEGQEDKINTLGEDCICLTARGKPIKSKTLGQKRYIEAIKKNVIVFGVGPAGTGKTYLAVAMAVTAFRNKEVNKIILTRPAVEAGEKLGFLPGDLQNKVDPYLRPLYDALYDMLGVETYQKYLERGMIEIAPLAYMRGRTLDDAYIILDEAQNTTPEQMKMFLTRIGFGSKAIITGDITQIDLPMGKRSGLKEAIKILKNIEGLEFVFLTEKDVVRHPLVQKIIKAYEKFDEGIEKQER